MTTARIKTLKFEGADYSSDVEKRSWRKRRCRATFGRIDEDYFELLKLVGSCYLEMEEDEDDPTYLTFWENLKPHRNSYMLDVSLDHGVLSPIKYHAENDPPDKLKRRALKSCSSTLIQECRNLGENSKLESGAEKDDPLKEVTIIRKRSCLSVSTEQKKSGLKDYGSRKVKPQKSTRKVVQNLMISTKKNPVSNLREEFGGPLGQDHLSNSRIDIVNNSYSVFSSGLKDNGESVLYKCGVGKLVCFEESDQQNSSDVQNKPSKTVSLTKCQTSRPQNPTLTKREPAPTPTPRAPARTHAPIPRARTAKDHRCGSDKRASTLIPTPRPPTSSPAPIPRAPTAKDRRNGSDKSFKRAYTAQIPTPKPATSTPTPIPGTPTAKGHCDASNNPSKRDSKTQVPTPTQTTSSSRALTSSPTVIPKTSVLKDCRLSNTYSKSTHLFPDSSSNSKSTFSKMLANKGNTPQKSRPWFHERLENICTEPYKQKEYEDLLEKVNIRKPVIVHKQLRYRDYTKTGELGKSYLDNFPDLRDEITKVKSDRKKVLNLLRGFFFYLLHVSHGIPRPWKNESCRAIMLGSA